MDAETAVRCRGSALVVTASSSWRWMRNLSMFAGRPVGDLAAARATQLRALAIKEAVYGPDHPQVAVTLGNLGKLERLLGNLAAAREAWTRAHAVFTAKLGSTHPYTQHAARLLDALDG
jgi:Tetratricopeptide repeat